MSTTAVETLESLQEADPQSAFQGEQSDLGSWIHDSFSALEKLHEELTQWQSELARKETELDLRQDALSKAPAPEKAGPNQTGLDEQLAKLKKDLQQLEEENGQHLRELKDFESRSGELELHSRVARQRIEELETTLASERERAASDRALWKTEFEHLRDEIAKYYQLLAEQLDVVTAAQQGDHESHTPLPAGAVHAKSAELRRRAQSRRDTKGRN